MTASELINAIREMVLERPEVANWTVDVVAESRKVILADFENGEIVTMSVKETEQ